MQLFSLETVVAALERLHNIIDVLLGVVLCILKVVFHDVVWIETKLRSNLRLLCIVDNQELICTNFLRTIDALR